MKVSEQAAVVSRRIANDGGERLGIKNENDRQKEGRSDREKVGNTSELFLASFHLHSQLVGRGKKMKGQYFSHSFQHNL